MDNQEIFFWTADGSSGGLWSNNLTEQHNLNLLELGCFGFMLRAMFSLYF